MNKQRYFELFALFTVNPIEFAVLIQSLDPGQLDADFLSSCAQDESLSGDQRVAALGIMIIHFRDRVNVKVTGKPSKSLMTEVKRIQTDISARTFSRRN